MKEQDLSRRRSPFSWRSITVVTVSLVGTLIAWLVVRADENSHIRKTITSAVASVRADVAYDINSWVREQIGLADLWKLEEPSRERWTAFANTYVEHHPGCFAIEWLDPDYREHWVVRPKGDVRRQLSLQGDKSRERLLSSALQSRKAAISNILTADSGEKQWLAAVPIYRQQEFRGFVLASFDAQQSLDSMMDDIQVLNFSVALEENGRESYRLVGSTDQNKNEWQEAFDVPLPGNIWRMWTWPKPEAMNETRSGLPQLTLLFGILLTFLLAWIAQSNNTLRVEIAERRRAEDALRASQARFAGILEMSADAVISTNADQRITLYNQAAEGTFGYQAEEALGQPLDMLIPKRFREPYRKHVGRLVQSGQKNLFLSEGGPFIGLRKNGSEFPMSASISKLNLGGDTVFTVLGHDITAQVLIEEELRRARDYLELRVVERTAELARANLALQSEIADRIQAEKDVQELSRRVMHVQNEERRRLARELHDGAIQNLVAVALNLNGLRETVACEPIVHNKVDESALLLQQCTNELRTISHLLHPPLLEELGVARTLSGYVDGFSKRSGIHVKLEVEPELGRLDFDVELAIFRIVQEALANIHRHSQSSTASIILACEEDGVVLEIADRGRGIPKGVDATGVGIAGMRERVRLLQGRLEIKTGTSGVTIRAIFPFSEPKHFAELNTAVVLNEQIENNDVLAL